MVTAPVYRVRGAGGVIREAVSYGGRVTISLAGLRRYPVKSCRGESLTQAVVEPWGLASDRRWMLVDDTGAAITAREVNAMVLLRPEITPDGLRLEAPGRSPLEVTRPDPAQQVSVSVFSSHITAAVADRDATAWLSDALGVAARLVWLDDPTRRASDPRYTEPGDRVSLADGYPLLLASETSLADLGIEGVSMTRFRPNLVVRGAAAWAEDDWRRIRIGETTFRSVKGCARCVLTTVDPETAARGKEPIATLARVRRWDGKTWFGVNLVPETLPAPGQTIGVGDEVEVLEAVAAGSGPLR